MQRDGKIIAIIVISVLIICAVAIVIGIGMMNSEPEDNTVNISTGEINDDIAGSDEDEFEIYDGLLAELVPNEVYVSECRVAKDRAEIKVTVKSKSYGGALTEVINIDEDGTITDVEVISHGDTPGLGTKAHEDSHLVQYIGLDEYTATTAVEDDNVVHVSGATKSSNAVHYGVCAALEQYKIVMGN